MLRFFAILFLFLFISCSNEESDSGLGPEDIGLGSFSVKIDGSTWSATQGFVFASISTSDSVSSALVTSVKSLTTNNSEGFGISFSNILTGSPTLEGTYPLDGTVAAAVVFVRTISDNNMSYLSISGEIKILEITSTNIKGTFKGVCVNQEDQNDTFTMTDGEFNAAIVN